MNTPPENVALPSAARICRSAAGGKNRQGDLKLLLAEVSQYLSQVQAYLAAPSFKFREELRHKVAYINTLSLVVRNHNFDLERDGMMDEVSRRYHHGLASITGRLHRIAELALNVVRQFGHLSRVGFLEAYALDDFFEEIELGLSMIRPALEQRKLKLVVRLCQVEERLDAHYADRFRRLIREMDEGRGDPGDRVTTLMIVHYLERIGDLILEIGEEMIHIILGENLKFSQYLALEDGLRAAGRTGGPKAAPGDFQSIWSGRSGCRIGVIGGEVGGTPVIFKHGPVSKLIKERDNLETWAQLWPGLPPAVLAFIPADGDRAGGPPASGSDDQKQPPQWGGEASLVLEYIQGATLKDRFIDPDDGGDLGELTGALNLMAGLWRETRVEEECRAGFVRQAEKRLGPVRALYPDLVEFRGSVGRLSIPSLSELLTEARALERPLAAPFTVRIHGDFNLSNIMRDERNGTFRFIDLHRSAPGDYAQDLSVMILSILRLPVRGRSARARLSQAANLTWTFALDFAAAMDDPTLAARLTFGLARSFLTSARFEPRRRAAARFLGYSRFLWESLIKYGRTARSWSDFKLDKRALYV